MINQEFSTQDILDYILKGYTIDEIANISNKSWQWVCSKVSVLKNNGYIDKDFQIKRDYNPLKKQINTDNLDVEIVESVDKAELKDTKNKVENNKKLKVVKADFLAEEELSISELFSGYDELYAITYSSSPDFIEELSNNFDKTEIIFGCQEALNGTVTNLFASQLELMNILKKNTYFNKLKQKIDDKKLNIFLLHEKVSHQKIYILKGENKWRVILGSANMSSRAFGGIQEENIIYIDGLEAYRYYKNIYEKLKLESSGKLDLNTVEVKDKFQVEDTPLYGIIKEKETVYVEKPENLDLDIFNFTTSVDDISENLREFLPETTKKKHLDKQKLDYDDISKALVKRDFLVKEKEEKLKEFPIFNINRLTGEITFNNLDFRQFVEDNYKNANVKSDIKHIFTFFNKMNTFIGDYRHSQNCFWKLLVTSFASPFFVECRNHAYKYGHTLSTFPMYSIIYGNSNASKTTIVKLLETAMFGRIFPFNGDSDFKPTVVFGLKNKIQGVPIVFDDVSSARFSDYASKIIKEDYYDIKHKTNSSMCIITSNEIKSLKPEIVKRSVMLNVSANINQLTGMENEKIINDILKNISPKFYLEYLDIFIPKLNKMFNDMKEGGVPDIFKISSESLIEVIKKYYEKLPSYIVSLSWENYFGDSNIGYVVLQEIKEYYKHSKENFKIDKKQNIIEIFYEDAFVPRRLVNELPKKMEAQVQGKKLVLKLNEADEYLHIFNNKTILTRQKQQYNKNIAKNKKDSLGNTFFRFKKVK